MPPLERDKENRVGLTEREIGQLFARLDAQDKQLADLKAQSECILEGINGSAQVKGIAGHIRDLNAWRAEVEKERPLVLTLDEIRQRHAREDEERSQFAKDWRSVLLPIATQLITSALGTALIIIAAIRAGIIH